MFRRSRTNPSDDPTAEAGSGRTTCLAPDDAELDIVGEPGLAALPIAGITRRRMSAVVATILAAWIVIVFVRQVSAAQAATERVAEIASGNIALRAQVSSLEREFELIGRQRYIEQQARGYGLGSPREIAFTLARDAPPLPDDAPGSAAVRVGAATADVTPLERWLTVLFGPSD